MNKLINAIDRVPVDNKLLTTLVTLALTRLVLAVGLDVNDPLVGTVISLAVAAVVGYFTPNDGTILRTHHSDGNADVPEVL